MGSKNSAKDRQPLVLENVTRLFGSLAAVSDVSLIIEQGNVHSVIGPNGAGKTTLFNLISGNLKCSAGQIRFYGRNITNKPPYMRARMGLGRTFQITSLFQELTVGQNIMLAVAPKEFGFRSFKIAKEKVSSALVLLEEFYLAEKWDTEVKNLSHGEQRQVEVILGRALNSKVLLLDEPFAGLSPAESSQMIDMINRIKEVVTVVLVEHDFDAVFELSNRITVMLTGKILSEGTPEEISNDPKVQEAYLGSI